MKKRFIDHMGNIYKLENRVSGRRVNGMHIKTEYGEIYVFRKYSKLELLILEIKRVFLNTIRRMRKSPR